jgi:hypothetical protein
VASRMQQMVSRGGDLRGGVLCRAAASRAARTGWRLAAQGRACIAAASSRAGRRDVHGLPEKESAAACRSGGGSAGKVRRRSS